MHGTCPTVGVSCCPDRRGARDGLRRRAKLGLSLSLRSSRWRERPPRWATAI
jgi:hypothetical protein